MEIPRARGRHRPERQAVDCRADGCAGQEGDPDIPGSCSNFSTLQAGISRSSTQPLELFSWKRGYTILSEATVAYEGLVVSVIDGTFDPSQPVFRQDLED